MNFIVFAQNQVPGSQKGSCSRIRKASSTADLALFPRPKSRKSRGREGWLAPCPFCSASSSGKGMESNCLGVPSPGLCCYFNGISDSSLTSLALRWDRFCDSKLYSKEP